MLLKSLMQWIHVGSVVLMIGGFFFFRVVLLPIANRSDEPAALIASSLATFRWYRLDSVANHPHIGLV